MNTLELVRNFKNKIKKGPVFGPFSKTIDPALIECLGFAGFDFVILDLEHGPNTTENLQNLIRAAQISNLTPIVRVKENLPSLLGEVLDSGAGGVQVPHVSNAKDIKKILEKTKFSPWGMRGVCRYVRAAEYSNMDKIKYFKEANETIIIAQIEGEEAIKNIDEILEVKGVDVVFIGPYDLSQSLGVPGEVEHPLVTEKIKKVVEKCNKKNISVGSFVENFEMGRKFIEYGMRYISYSVDMGIFFEANKKIVGQLSLYKKNL